MPRHYGDANQTDLTDMVACPLCNKDMVIGKWHACKRLLHSHEYTNEVLGIRLYWSVDYGWCSYSLVVGNRLNRLAFDDVFNAVTQSNNYVAVDPMED